MAENDDAAPKRGAARMRQIATSDRAKRDELEAELISGLGRTPAAIDRLAIATLAATAVRAERLRQAGKNDADERRLVAQLIRTTGLRPAPATAPAPLTIAQQLAAAGYAPPAENEPSVEFDDDEAALSGASDEVVA